MGRVARGIAVISVIQAVISQISSHTQQPVTQYVVSNIAPQHGSNAPQYGSNAPYETKGPQIIQKPNLPFALSNVPSAVSPAPAHLSPTVCPQPVSSKPPLDPEPVEVTTGPLDTNVLNNLAIALQLLIISNIMNIPSHPEKAVTLTKPPAPKYEISSPVYAVPSVLEVLPKPSLYSYESQAKPTLYYETQSLANPSLYTYDAQFKPSLYTYEAPLNKPGSYSYEAPLIKPASYSYETLTNKPGSYSYEAPLNKPGSYSYETLINKPGSYSYEAPLNKPASYSYETPLIKPASYSYETPLNKPGLYTYEEPLNKPGLYSNEEPLNKPGSYSYETQSLLNANFLGSSGFSDPGFGSIGTTTRPNPRSGMTLMSPYDALETSSFGDSLSYSKKDFQSPYASILAADGVKDLFSSSGLF